MNWSIYIEKLFETYDVKFDMGQRFNIMIGENGIGKSTVLKIIDATFKRDFTELSKYTFAKLTIQTENGTLEIKYEDLFPVCKDLEEIYLRKRHREVENDFEEDFENLFSSLYRLEKESKYNFASYLSKCYHDLPLSSRMKSSIDKQCYVCPKPGFDPIVEIRKLLMYIKNESIGENALINLNSRMNVFEIPRNVILTNRVDSIPLMDDEIIEPYYFAPALKWIYSQDKDYFGHSSENIANEYNLLLKKMYESINFDANFEISSGQMLLHELGNQSQLNINKIINLASYSKEFIRGINEIAAKNSLELIEANNQTCVQLDRSFFNVKVINDIENYLLPLILSDTILGKFMNEVISNENNGWLTCEYPQKLVEMFVDFYTSNIENVFAACDSRIKVFEELLNSFSTNKTYRIYPSGIKIYTINERKLKMRNLDLSSKDINQIKLTELSSGEKKLMLMLLKSLFLENGLLLIDEPELSFTILWQEKILPTLIERTGIENVIVATHSPFIASRDDMREFLVALPMEV